jgi:hypothetical protein
MKATASERARSKLNGARHDEATTDALVRDGVSRRRATFDATAQGASTRDAIRLTHRISLSRAMAAAQIAVENE